MHVRISNQGATCTDLVMVSVVRPDQSPGEPTSLAREHVLELGESATFDLPQTVILVLSVLGDFGVTSQE